MIDGFKAATGIPHGVLKVDILKPHPPYPVGMLRSHQGKGKINLIPEKVGRDRE
jgi:hypothetical protein